MHYVDENNDELFRRAAKDYPLNTGSADWNKVAAILYDQLPLSQKPSNQRKYLWLLLLLPLMPVCNRYVENRVGDDIPTQTVQIKSGNEKTLLIPRTDQDRTAFVSIQKKLATKNGKHLLKKANRSSLKCVVLVSRRKENFPVVSNKTGDKQTQDPIDEMEKDNERSPINKNIMPIAARQLPVEAVEKNVNAEHNDVVNINDRKSCVEQHGKKFFIGLEAGTGATTVNFNKTKSLGFDVGVLVGFDVSKKFSVEAAVLSSKKFYYANGAAFNTSKIYLPTNTKITSVDGNCRMIELPLALHYRFSPSEKKQWFVSAGLSNFFMQRENYDYQYLYLNSGQSVKRSRTYKNPAKEWMAAAQLSGGLLYNFKGTFGIKAEPYVQLPLKGVGTGKLPLTSAGLRLALVKKLF